MTNINDKHGPSLNTKGNSTMTNTINTPEFKVNFTYTMLDHEDSKTLVVHDFVSSALRNADRVEALLASDVKPGGLLLKVEFDLAEARRILTMLESHIWSAEDNGTFESVLETRIVIAALTSTQDRLVEISESTITLP